MSIIPPSEPFKQEKISPIAVDHFAKEYQTTTDPGIPYRLQSGERITVSLKDILSKKRF